MDVMAALARELGAAALSTAPLELEGARLEGRVRPASAEACAAALRVCAEAGAGVLVRGAGTRLAGARAPCTARVLLETTGLCGAPEIDLEEGVASLPAGLALAELEAQVGGGIWELPLDPPGAGSTLGGALASAAVGPRFAGPRDFVLGLSAALASGECVKSGGRVVKNVTGYDLSKLFVGSQGALGVITSAWIRLRPRPERCLPLVVALPEDTRALAAARRPSVRVAAALGGDLVLELAGDAAAVASDERALATELGARAAAPDAVARVRAAQAEGPLRLRFATLPAQALALARELASAGARTLAYPARGLVYAALPPAEPQDAPRFVEAGRAAAARARAAWRIEDAPAGLRSGEVAGGPDDAAALQRAVKRAFDPHGILNPGRGPGEP
jgi:FAD/FMN-containing dehydrogenase